MILWNHVLARMNRLEASFGSLAYIKSWLRYRSSCVPSFGRAFRGWVDVARVTAVPLSNQVAPLTPEALEKCAVLRPRSGGGIDQDPALTATHPPSHLTAPITSFAARFRRFESLARLTTYSLGAIHTCLVPAGRDRPGRHAINDAAGHGLAHRAGRYTETRR